jgi:hypothetical protein
MYWQCSLPKDRIFADFLTLIRNNPGKKVFVHCRVGDDRTGMMIAAYRMAEVGWTAKQAMEEMTKYGFSFAHRRLICPRLSEYEEHFPERFATKPEFEELRSTKSIQPAPEAPPPQPQPEPLAHRNHTPSLEKGWQRPLSSLGLTVPKIRALGYSWYGACSCFESERSGRSLGLQSVPAVLYLCHNRPVQHKNKIINKITLTPLNSPTSCYEAKLGDYPQAL